MASTDMYHDLTLECDLESLLMLERRGGEGLQDIRAISGVVKVETKWSQNSIHSVGTITIRGSHEGLTKGLLSVFHRLECIKNLTYNESCQIARTNDLALKLQDLKDEMASKLAKKDCEISHFRDQALRALDGENAAVIPFNSESSSSDSDSESTCSSTMSQFTEHKQTLFDRKVEKRQSEGKSALSSIVMKKYLPLFLRDTPMAPDEIRTSIDEFRTAFIRFLKNRNTTFRKVRNTKGLNQQLIAHLKQDYGRLLQDVDGTLQVKVLVDWPSHS